MAACGTGVWPQTALIYLAAVKLTQEINYCLTVFRSYKFGLCNAGRLIVASPTTMAKALAEYFAEVCSSDAYDYGHGRKRDFLAHPFSLRFG
jgi:hypothetical protein